MTRPLLHESTVFDGRPNRHLSDPPANWQPLLPRFSFNPMYLPAIPLTPDPALALAVAHPVGPKKKRSRADSPNEVDLLLGGQLPGDSFRGLAWIGDAVLLVTLRERLLRLAPQSGSLNQVNSIAKNLVSNRTLSHLARWYSLQRLTDRPDSPMSQARAADLFEAYIGALWKCTLTDTTGKKSLELVHFFEALWDAKVWNVLESLRPALRDPPPYNARTCPDGGFQRPLRPLPQRLGPRGVGYTPFIPHYSPMEHALRAYYIAHLPPSPYFFGLDNIASPFEFQFDSGSYNPLPDCSRGTDRYLLDQRDCKRRRRV